MKIITSKTFKEEISKNKYSLLKIGSTWCGPCKMLSNTLKQIQTDFPIYDMDTDTNMEFCNEYQITNIPVIMIFDKDGNTVERFNKALTKDEIEQLISKYSS